MRFCIVIPLQYSGSYQLLFFLNALAICWFNFAGVISGEYSLKFSLNVHPSRNLEHP